jgi:RNA polymerase sigma-70 factor, ECF subfamily
MSTVERQSDELLLAEVLGGKKEALAALVERYQQPLANYLNHLVGPDWALAQDLTQETFLRVLRQQASRGDRPFKPWLYAIATNLARDHYKSAAVRRETSLEPQHEADIVDETPGPEADALAAEQHVALIRALRTLTAEYRAALVLRYDSRLSLQEIAVTLDIPLGTVKSRLSVGLRRLREALQAAEAY